MDKSIETRTTLVLLFSNPIIAINVCASMFRLPKRYPRFFLQYRFGVMSLKQQKENFVTGWTGGSVSEIYWVTLVALSGYLAYNMIRSTSRNLPFVVDFSLQVVAILLAVTLYCNTIGTLHGLVLGPAVLVMFSGAPKKTQKSKSVNSSNELLPQKPFLTAYRAQMLILTNIAILAVDFKVFPRRFAKVETWGTSMMDIGVGSFVFSMGLASSRLLIKQILQQNYKRGSYVGLVFRSSVKAMPVLGLGLVRLISVKSLEYQEHVTEYGIHWNFFITLGFLPICLAFLNPVIEIIPRVFLAFFVTICHEVALHKGLQQFVLRSDNRMDNLVTMNKEGICSLPGYFSIFLFGQCFGYFVLPGRKTRNNLFGASQGSTQTKWTVTTNQGLIIATLVSHGCFWYCQNSFLVSQVSRRLGNISYVMWVVSYNSSMLLAYHWINQAFPNASMSPILQAINKNGLAIFLLANVTTGVVNMTINTLECGSICAVAILAVYGLSWVVVAIILERRKIYIKL